MVKLTTVSSRKSLWGGAESLLQVMKGGWGRGGRPACGLRTEEEGVAADYGGRLGVMLREEVGAGIEAGGLPDGARGACIASL